MFIIHYVLLYPVSADSELTEGEHDNGLVGRNREKMEDSLLMVGKDRGCMKRF